MLDKVEVAHIREKLGKFPDGVYGDVDAFIESLERGEQFEFYEKEHAKSLRYLDDRVRVEFLVRLR